MHELVPSDIKTNSDTGFLGSNLGHNELEIVARNIIIQSKRQNKWHYFTCDDYRNMCPHNVTQQECDTLDELVKKGFLAKVDNRYSVKTKNLHRLIGDYIM